MPVLSLEAVGFHYEHPYAPVFERVDLQVDVGWRTGLVGRNGRGKTTLLRLIQGCESPQRGRVHVPVEVRPFEPARPGCPGDARHVVRESVAPFAGWEAEMRVLVDRADPASLERYGEVALEYERLGGYTIDHRIEDEWVAMGLDPALLERRHDSLSGGERTRASIVSLFLRPGSYPLIDEPTNHLDREGRDHLARYLERKPGFLMASHDRALLDCCCDHFVAIERGALRLHRGDYTSLRAQKRLEEGHEGRERERLSREVRQLERAARERRQWSGAKEKSKIGAYDKGYVGHRAARMMKRALHTERRAEDKLAQKKALLRIPEKQRRLKLDHAPGPETVLVAEGLRVEIEGRVLVEHLDLRVRRGERVAVVGPNGSGKTLLLRTLLGEREPAAGRVTRSRGVELGVAHQIPVWQEGRLADHLERAAIDATRFRNVLGVFGIEGDAFDRPLSTLSEGERRKADLARSFLAPYQGWVWDEPLNYLDIESREQIEDAVLRAEPTLIFVEHDAWFGERVATREIRLGAIQSGTEREGSGLRRGRRA